MNLTRRQFGLACIGGFFALLLSRILGGWGRGLISGNQPMMRARFWKRADRLAG